MVKIDDVYKSVVNSLFNVINSEFLVVEIKYNQTFKSLFLKEIDDLFYMEKDLNKRLNDEEWALTFGKALANITKQSEEIEKVKTTIEKCNENLLNFLEYIVATYNIDAEKIINEYQNISKENIIKMSKNVGGIEKKVVNEYKNLSTNDEINIASTQALADKVDKSNNKTIGVDDLKNINFDQINSIGHPLKDPRFYPFVSKPQLEIYLKYALVGIISLLTIFSLTLFLLQIYNVDLNYSLVTLQHPDIFNSWTTNYKSDGGSEISNQITGKLTLIQGNTLIIPLTFLFFSFAIIFYITYSFRNSTKYRFSFLNFCGALIVIITMNYNAYGFLSNATIKSLLTALAQADFRRYFDFANPSYTESMFNNDIKTLVNIFVLEIPDSFKALAVIIITFSIVTLGIAAVALAISPKIDYQKIELANQEYQKMVMAAYQGKKYEPDQSLFAEVIEVKIFPKKNKPKGNKTDKDKIVDAKQKD